MNEDCFHLGVKALLKNKVGEYLLLKVNTKILRDHKDGPYWDIPGGRIRKGDTVEGTLRRELEEETGITSVGAFRPLAMVISPLRIPLKDGGDVGLILSVYRCDLGEDQPIRISDEHTEYAWFAPQEAARLLQFKYPKEFTDKIGAPLPLE